MFNWLWKNMGYHVCEEFTRWEDHMENFTRNPSIAEHACGIEKVLFTEAWQERRCTICGKVEQKKLEYARGPGSTIRKSKKEQP